MEAEIDLDGGPSENHSSASSLQIYRYGNQPYLVTEAQVYEGLSENHLSASSLQLCLHSN